MFSIACAILLVLVAPGLAESPPSPPTFVDKCALPLVIGPCYALFPSWGYEDGKCKRFNYGGCEGNENRFSSKAKCETECDLSGRDVCDISPDTGSCRALFVKWTYYQGKCIQFVYGGCGGNTNRFNSKAECEQRCDVVRDQCDLRLVTGPCEAAIPRWGYKNGKCQKFTYGGCQGNANRFGTKTQCQKACDDDRDNKRRCTLPSETGPCRAAITKWAYDDGECKTFIYGGCQGNKNNFDSKRQCEKLCEEDVRCELPLVTGPCRATFPRWGYEDGECKTFIFGGCGGNSNRFNTKRQCHKACDDKKPRKCSMPLRKDPRPSCDVTKSGQKWGYDEEAGECIQFNWNNCRGTLNKFGSRRACKKACHD